jgi:hypothetical protein
MEIVPNKSLSLSLSLSLRGSVLGLCDQLDKRNMSQEDIDDVCDQLDKKNTNMSQKVIDDVCNQLGKIKKVLWNEEIDYNPTQNLPPIKKRMLPLLKLL